MKTIQLVAAIAWFCAHSLSVVAGTGAADNLTTAQLKIKLPFPEGSSYQVFQGNDGAFSHTGQNRYAWDFGLPEGSPVCAAAAGRVVQIKQDSENGGTSVEDRGAGNTVILDHGGGYYTQYLHLKRDSVHVKEGEIVRGGQILASSGHTGYSSVPHLHFQVQDVIGQSLPARFVDVAGDGIPTRGDICESHNDGSGVLAYGGESPLALDVFAKNSIILTETDLPGHLLKADNTYRAAGIVRKPCGRVVLYLIPNTGGKSLVAYFAKVGPDGRFSLKFDLKALRRKVPRWSESGSQSNVFALVIAPVEADGSYWSTISVLVAVR